MNISAASADEVFAGNRTFGRIAFTAAARTGETRRARVHESGALRLRFPNGSSQALDAVIVNTAGGMTGGDRFDIEANVGPGAQATVTTAAAEKIYRSLGPDTEIAVRLSVGASGKLAWLPQETILFDRMRLRRSIDVALAPGATFLLAEAVVFGRAAMGETVVSGHFSDRWRVRVDGRLIYAETVRLDGNIAQRLAQRAIARGGVAIASMIAVPGDEETVAALRAKQQDFCAEVGASAWNGLAVARFVAHDSASLRRDLVAAATALRGAALPRLWLN
jgi:urease accessory protein